ncbi:hypothetical protein [Streptomyces tauricus]
MSSEMCWHPLRLVAHAPAWLSCDVHRAAFPHHRECPGYGTPGCISLCANGTPTGEQLLGMAVELLQKTPPAYALMSPCGAVPRDLARALVLPMNHAYGHATSSGAGGDFVGELVAVARALLCRPAPGGTEPEAGQR